MSAWQIERLNGVTWRHESVKHLGSHTIGRDHRSTAPLSRLAECNLHPPPHLPSLSLSKCLKKMYT